MGANGKPQAHVDINLPCDTWAQELQTRAVEGVSPEQLENRSPALWQHLQSCPACASYYAELLRLIHAEGHREAHAEEQAIRRTITLVASLAVVLISLVALGRLRWMSTGEKAVASRIYQQAGPAVVLIVAARRTGSGMIFDREGHILTNNHVIEGAGEISVRLVDGATLSARLVGRDPATDLAVLQIDIAGHPIGVVRFGDSDKLKIGDLAVVIGNPFDLERSLTVGYISALNRILSTQDPYGAQIYGGIQTDAAINPGNSGGPLLNAEGEVVGVATSILPGPSGGSIGVGFAVPINTAKAVIDALLSRGYVSRPYLGVVGRPLTPPEVTSLGLPAERGLVVSRIDSGSPAEQAGLLTSTRSTASVTPRTAIGDVILALDGQPVGSLSELWRLLQKHAIGDEVVLTVWRAGQELELAVRLSEQPPPQ